ncbi:unnamed protein product [Phytophthora lilii]|uniref:Unnamed protein product n=1 Tax=Phytophthora lilii TaxID=2077276 RepID=A0A9W6U6V4_9STRA|nr:unnamed protein product [Phytophthora lilii]
MHLTCGSYVQDGLNPLSNLIIAQQHELDDESVAIAHLLCSFGSVPNLPVLANTPLGHDQKGLLACTKFWSQCSSRGEPLPNVPPEVIRAGEAAVKIYLTYLKEVPSPEADPIGKEVVSSVYRRKICIIGPK